MSDTNTKQAFALNTELTHNKGDCASPEFTNSTCEMCVKCECDAVAVHEE